MAATDNFCRIIAGRPAKIVCVSSGAVYGQMPATLAGVDKLYTDDNNIMLKVFS